MLQVSKLHSQAAHKRRVSAQANAYIEQQKEKRRQKTERRLQKERSKTEKHNTQSAYHLVGGQSSPPIAQLLAASITARRAMFGKLLKSAASTFNVIDRTGSRAVEWGAFAQGLEELGMALQPLQLQQLIGECLVGISESCVLADSEIVTHFWLPLDCRRS